MNMHVLEGRFYVAYNLTNQQWWVQERFEWFGAFDKYTDVLAAVERSK